jgi:IclR family pca regulon transcriptional regulator
MSDSRPEETVQSLERGLAVIRAFDGEHPRLTLSEVATRCELPRAAARRFLRTLVALGYVHTDGRLFALRPRILDLGYAYLSSLSLPEVATPHLEALVAQAHESSSLSVLDGEDVVYVARVSTRRIMTVSISVGTRFPAYATSMGRVLLAHQEPRWLDTYLSGRRFAAITEHTKTDGEQLRNELTMIRERGWALVDQELEDGLRAVAAPVRDRTGSVVAALNISAQAQRWQPAAMEAELIPPLLATARAIETDLRSGH